MSPVSISEIKAFNENPAEWWFKHVLRRVPIVEPVALQFGTILHTGMERILRDEPRDAIVEDFKSSVEDAAVGYEALGREKLADAIRSLRKRMAEILEAWQMEIPVTVLATEESLSMPFGEYTLIGRLDARVEMGGYMGHMQHKGLAPRNWPQWVDHYLQSRECDPHETAYRLLVEHNFPGVPYLGTYMNILLKSGKDKAPIQRLIMPRLDGLAEDLLWSLDRMSECRIRGRAPWFRERALSPWGSLSPYFDVLMGRADIMDDALFRTTEPRYSEAIDDSSGV